MMRLSKIILSLVGLTVLVPAGMSSPAEAALIGAGANNMNAPVYSIDTATGVQTLLGNSGFPNLQALALSPTGVLYGTVGTSGNQSLVTVNQTTGAATLVSQITGPQTGSGITFVTGLGFSPTGELYAVGRDNFEQVGSLYTLGTTTGVITRIGSTNATQTQDMAFAPNGSAFAVNTGGDAATKGLRTMDLMTGNTTFIGPAGGTGAINLAGMTFSPDGTLWASGNGNLYNLDTTTGAMSLQFSGLATFNSLAYVAPVPVPAAVWLFGSGLAAMVGFARRKSSSNSY